MRCWLIMGCFVFLLSCSDESAPASTKLVQESSPPVVPLPALLSNTMLNCGEWSQYLTEFKPAYSLQRHQRWVVMGSSSAFGAGASVYSKSWAGLLTSVAEEYGAEVINIARGGYTTYHAMSTDCSVNSGRPQPDPAHNIDLALELGADLVILSFPSNDAASGFPAEETAYNLLYMRARLADKGIPLLVLGAQPRNMVVSKQRLLTGLDALLKPRFAPCLVELYRFLVDDTGNLATQYNAGDGVHLTDAGHALVFAELENSISTHTDNSCFSN